jgi:hypothetical protein
MVHFLSVIPLTSRGLPAISSINVARIYGISGSNLRFFLTEGNSKGFQLAPDKQQTIKNTLTVTNRICRHKSHRPQHKKGLCNYFFFGLWTFEISNMQIARSTVNASISVCLSDCACVCVCARAWELGIIHYAHSHTHSHSPRTRNHQHLT